MEGQMMNFTRDTEPLLCIALRASLSGHVPEEACLESHIEACRMLTHGGSDSRRVCCDHEHEFPCECTSYESGARP